MLRKEVASISVTYADGETAVFSGLEGWHFVRNFSEEKPKEGLTVWKDHEIHFKTDRQKVQKT